MKVAVAYFILVVLCLAATPQSSAFVFNLQKKSGKFVQSLKSNHNELNLFPNLNEASASLISIKGR